MDVPPDTSALATEISSTDQDNFFAAMNGDDPLVLVIKAAIFIENQLIQLIEETVVSKEQINKMNISYIDRVHLASALGLHDRLVPPLKALATIRNRFAHRLDAQLSDQELKNFHKSFSPQDRQVIEAVYQRTRTVTLKKQPSNLSSLPPLERFTLYVAALRGALIAARAQASTSVTR